MSDNNWDTSVVVVCAECSWESHWASWVECSLLAMGIVHGDHEINDHVGEKLSCDFGPGVKAMSSRESDPRGNSCRVKCKGGVEHSVLAEDWWVTCTMSAVLAVVVHPNSTVSDNESLTAWCMSTMCSEGSH